MSEYLHHDVTKNSHLPALARTLRTGNPELVAKYHHEMLEYYKRHNMTEHIELLYNNFHALSPELKKPKLEAWDGDQRWAMKSAEKRLQNRNQYVHGHQHSPTKPQLKAIGSYGCAKPLT
jgi:hypothetical protein